MFATIYFQCLNVSMQRIHEKHIKDGALASGKTFLTAEEVADRWGVAKQNLATMRYQGTGPIFTKIGGRIRYELQDVEAYEVSRRFQRTDTQANAH